MRRLMSGNAIVVLGVDKPEGAHQVPAGNGVKVVGREVYNV